MKLGKSVSLHKCVPVSHPW